MQHVRALLLLFLLKTIINYSKSGSRPTATTIRTRVRAHVFPTRTDLSFLFPCVSIHYRSLSHDDTFRQKRAKAPWLYPSSDNMFVDSISSQQCGMYRLYLSSSASQDSPGT
uniref:Putative secreted protein n=1 Tax=Anopheles darlingi TaxID=43151 RepID=A0A2M4DGI4_ANODA